MHPLKKYLRAARAVTDARGLHLGYSLDEDRERLARLAILLMPECLGNESSFRLSLRLAPLLEQAESTGPS